jgi:predicted NBD/HSP70 family sugar kinase
VSQTRVGSLESLRRLNRLRVIDALRAEGLISRADIARRTGLSRSTVSSLVSDLQADGLVVERAEPATAYGDQGGRPPILLSFDASAGAAVGIDFGHRHLRVAVSDLASNVLAERRLELDTDHAAQDGLDAATELVAEALETAGVDRSRVVGAGMGLPGPIEQHTGIVGSAAILPGWVGVAAAEEMRRRLDLPVAVDNDANLGALAEAAFGAARDASDLVYIKVSSGIGAGLILNGRLYRGTAGLAGELGHVLVDPQGLVCRCGNRGCLETLAASGALVDLLSRSHGTDVSVADMLRLAREGDLGCQRVIHDAGRAIGRAIADLLNVLNPELIVVGGELAAAGDLLLEGVRESISRAALPAAAGSARLVAGILGDRAQVLGAVALVVSEADRTLLPEPTITSPISRRRR